MSRRRSVTEDEHALWANVTRSISPLRKRKRLLAAPVIERAEPVPHTKRMVAPPVAARPVAAPPVKTAPPLAPLGRRLKQRVARGRDAIEARIDLHGLTQAQAHAALIRFLHRSQSDGARIALIVTGKGARDGAGERGVLKRQVPMWLRLPEFRSFVVGFEDAHIGHGGEGALYVRLRRSERNR
jgi:DNA-nicking Smr family endonuclease